MARNGRKILIAASGLVTTAAIMPACARWYADARGPDVFGTETVLAAAQGTKSTLVIQCNGDDGLRVALIFLATPAELDAVSKQPSGVPAKLLIRIDGGAVKTFNAHLTGWNDTHEGVVAEGRTTDLIAGVRAIGGAQNSIDAGIDIEGAKDSDTFDAVGSTAAIKTVTEHCKLGEGTQN
jgi:hypothetical protein